MILLPVFVWLLWCAALVPGYLASGGTRRGAGAFIGWASIALLAWGHTLGLAMFAAVLTLQLGQLGTTPFWIATFSALLAGALFAGGGVATAHLLALSGPARAHVRSILVVAAILAVNILIGAYFTSAPHQRGVFPTGVLVFLVWALGPPVSYAVAGFAQRARLRAHLRADCHHCKSPGASSNGRCTECGTPSLLLCHRCRRFTNRPSGAHCPSCHAVLGRRCWRCQYDLSGTTYDRCPECGAWRPKPAPPAAT